MIPLPKVQCQERSGYACREIVSLASPHCGDPSHFPGANGGAPVHRHDARPRAIPLTVSEDYDIVDETPDLDPVTFNARRVHITRRALEAWGGHPKALQAKIRQALLRGGYWRTVTGGHLLELGSHQMLLSSDGRRCQAYTRLPPKPPVVSGEPIESLEEPAWDREGVGLAPHTVRKFAGRHRVDEDRAEEELFDLLDDAATRGKQRRLNGGNHALVVDGFTLVLTPDGATVVDYRTVHAERTPSQVKDKVPSRFGGARRRNDWLMQRDVQLSNVPPERWRTSAEIPDVFQPDHVWITGEIVAHDRADASAARAAVHEALRQAAAAGQWAAATEGRHFLEHAGRRWILSPDGRAVTGCKPQWPQP